MSLEQQLAEQKIEEKLKKLLGEDAFRNNMQVSEEISKTTRAVRYLATQLVITKKWSNEDGCDHIDRVLEELYKILS